MGVEIFWHIYQILFYVWNCKQRLIINNYVKIRQRLLNQIRKFVKSCAEKAKKKLHDSNIGKPIF